MVELVPAFLLSLDEAHRLQYVEMLRDRLPGRAQPVLHDESRADLEQRLPVPLGQLIEDRPPRRVGKGLVDVVHRRSDDRQVAACLSTTVVSRASNVAGESNGDRIQGEWSLDLALTPEACHTPRAGGSAIGDENDDVDHDSGEPGRPALGRGRQPHAA